MRKNVNNSILFGYIRYILLRKLVKRGSKSKTRAGIGFFSLFISNRYNEKLNKKL